MSKGAEFSILESPWKLHTKSANMPRIGLVGML